MSLLSNFISNQLIKAIEHEFINHSADIQDTIIKEMENFLSLGAEWVKNKIENKVSNREQANEKGK
jgi:hypothetical protein